MLYYLWLDIKTERDRENNIKTHITMDFRKRNRWWMWMKERHIFSFFVLRWNKLELITAEAWTQWIGLSVP